MRGDQFLIRNQAVLLKIKDDQYKAIVTELTLELLYLLYSEKREIIQVGYVEISQ